MCEREREPTDPVACGAQTSVDGGGTGGWRRAVRASEREKERESRSPVCASLRRKSVGGGGTGGWGGGLKAGCASEREPIPRVRQPAAQISWWWRNRRVKVGCASERERAESSRARRQPAAQISWWRSTGGGWRGARCARAGENQSRSRAPACGAYQLGEVRDVAWATPQWSGERRQKPPLRAVCATRVCRRAVTRMQLVSVCARTHQDARARSSLPFILPTPSAAARLAQGERHRLVAGSTLSALPGQRVGEQAFLARRRRPAR